MSLSIIERDPAEIGIDLAAVAELVGQLGPLAVVDLETTGLPDDPDSEILEFGVVLLDPGRVATFQSLVRPGRRTRPKSPRNRDTVSTVARGSGHSEMTRGLCIDAAAKWILPVTRARSLDSEVRISYIGSLFT